MNRYYLLVDNCMGWLCYVVREEDKEIKEMIGVELLVQVDSSRIRDIMSRELHFGDRMFNNDSHSGWTISATEFNHIKELVELSPYHKKYLQLCKQ